MKKIFHFLLSVAAASVTAILCCAVAFAACDAHQMDGGVITEQPTCERIGIVTYTCQNEGCDYSYVEKMGNLGHCYETGICVTCGEVDELYVPEETVEEPLVAQEAAELAESAEPQASANASASCADITPNWAPSSPITRTSLSRICSLICNSFVAMGKHLHRFLREKTRTESCPREMTLPPLFRKKIVSTCRERNLQVRAGKRSALFSYPMSIPSLWRKVNTFREKIF